MGNILHDLIERCIARNKQPRQAHRTRVYQDEYSIYYASRNGTLQSAKPSDFHKAQLGIMPIAKNGFAIEQYAASVGKNWQTRYGFDDWEVKSWKQSYGVQVYTGMPSKYLTDLDFEFDIVRDHPDILLETLDALLTLTPNSCLTLSKSGGIRYSCRSPDYVHPRSTEEREYIAKYNQETGTRKALYLEIFGDKGLSRWDARYEIITGDLFDLPVIEDVDALFEIIDTLKAKIHVPTPPKKEKSKQTQQSQNNNKKARAPDENVHIVEGLPNDIEWIPTGEKGKYKSRRNDYPCQFTEHTKSHGNVQYYKDTHTDSSSEFCHNCREWQWIQKPKQNRTAPDRLHIIDTPPQTQTYKKTQADMTQQLYNWEKQTRNKKGKHLLNIITPAQTGKTTVIITTADKLTYITQTQKKAEEAYDEAIRIGKNAYLHKSRLYNRDHENWHNLPLGTDENSRPCIHPDPCNHIAVAGFSPTKEFCRIQCEIYELCKSELGGYLSQVRKVKHMDHVYFWQSEAFFADEVYHQRVKAALQDKNALLAIDEPNPADLTQVRIIDQNALRQTFNNIKWTPGAEDMAIVLKSILEGLSTADTPEDIRTALADATNTLSKTDIKQYDEKLSGIPFSFVWYRDDAARLYANVIYNNQTRKCFVVDDHNDTIGTIPQSILSEGVTLDKLETRFIGLALFERLGFIDLKQEAEASPRVWRKLLSDINKFVDKGSNACHRIDKISIVFYLPPSLNARRGITMNASDTDNLIGEVYRDTGISVETITGYPPPWKSGCKLFQISTGRYPPGNLFLYKTKARKKKRRAKKKVVGITPTLRHFLNIILKTAEKYNVLVIAPKRLQNAKIAPLIKQLNTHKNITMDTHRGAQGKNEYQDRDVVFVFCFEPQPKIVEAETRRIYPYATDLSYERQLVDVVIDGVKLKDVMRYIDERVQKVYNLLCERMHMQAIYRLRQALNENKIAILFSAEPVSQMPVTPVPFRKEQLQAFMDNPNWQLSELQQYLEAEAKKTPAEIAETEGVSERTGRRRTEVTRKRSKAEKKKRAKELDTQGVSVKGIIAELNIGKRTFYRWKADNFL